MSRFYRLTFQAAVFAATGWLIGTVGLDWTVQRLAAEARAETARQLAPGPLGQCLYRG